MYICSYMYLFNRLRILFDNDIDVSFFDFIDIVWVFEENINIIY